MKVNNNQPIQLQKRRRQQWWRSPWLGYPCAVLFSAAAFAIPLSERSLGIHDFFVEPPFVMVTLLIGWIWGIGPALLALVLEGIALDYWIVPPLNQIDFFRWPAIVSFASFILIQLTILVLVVLQKNYRQQLLDANQIAAQRAEELTESNTRLQQADQVKDQFLAMASHELKTPVTRIYGSIQLLQRRAKRQNDQTSTCDALDEIKQHIQHLVELINDLLDINTLRSGKIPVHLAPCDLCDLCRHIVQEQPQTERLIELWVPAHPVVVQADGQRFSQVVSNLVSNALKYSPTHSAIRLEVREEPREVMLSVYNQSPILSPEQLKTLFEPFYRSPEARSSTVPGWGLGLAICKEIVLQHNGRIWAESSEANGTIFFVALPLPAGSTEAFTQ